MKLWLLKVLVKSGMDYNNWVELNSNQKIYMKKIFLNIKLGT